jgi:hypothetical protein
VNNLQIVQTDGFLAQYEVSPNEVLTNELFTSILLAAREHDVLNLDVLLDIDRPSTDRELLTNNLFAWAGTVQVNRDQRVVTFIRFRRCVKRGQSAGVTAELAVPMPVLAPTPLEAEACELMRKRMSEPLSESKLAALAAMGRHESVEEPSIDVRLDRLRADAVTQ